jgi:hypothetical protein
MPARYGIDAPGPAQRRYADASICRLDSSSSGSLRLQPALLAADTPHSSRQCNRRRRTRGPLAFATTFVTSPALDGDAVYRSW